MCLELAREPLPPEKPLAAFGRVVLRRLAGQRLNALEKALTSEKPSR